MTLPSRSSNLMQAVKLDVFSSDLRELLTNNVPSREGTVCCGIAGCRCATDMLSERASLIGSLTKLANEIDELTGLELATFLGSSDFRALVTYADRLLAANPNFSDVEAIAKNGELTRFLEVIPLGQVAAFNTVAPNGDPIPGEGPVNPSQLKWTRARTVSGEKKTLVTYGFDPRFSLSGISNAEAKSLFVSALQTWATYAPIEFQEVEVVGKGNDVDILVHADNIDGPRGTLALAYFPTVGDIIFDGDEKWTKSLFLETALHEQGHSLGLAHEDDVDAILNSKLANRFADLNPFLFPDDIEGIRRLYGNGRGSVKTLESPAPVVATPPGSDQSTSNLVVNGSFEETSLRLGYYNTYTQIKGWNSLDNRVFQVDRRVGTLGSAADGTAWVELDARQGNASFGQNVDTVTGQAYTLSLAFTDGGRSPVTTEVEVFWEGRLIDTLKGGSKGQWNSFDYVVEGGARNVSTLAFRAIGEADYTGGFIDDVKVIARSGSQALTADYTLGTTSNPSASDPLTNSKGVFDQSLILSDSLNNTADSGLG